MENGGGEGVKGNSVGEVQQQANYQRHYHARGDGGSQYSHHEDRKVDHAEPEFSEQTLAASLAPRSLLVAIEPTPRSYHLGVVVLVVGKDALGDKHRARGSTHVWPPIRAGNLLLRLGMG